MRSQAQFLQRFGIAELVEEGRAAWASAAARADLEALRMRSRAVEAEALLDPAGLGGFTVARVGVPAPAEEVPTSFGPQEEVEWRIPAERRQQGAGW